MASASIKASWKVLGVEELIAALQDFKQSVRKRVIYNAVRKCGPVVTKAIKPGVPRETGTLKKSIGHRVYTHRGGDGAGVVIGPRKGFARQVVLRTKGKLRGKFRAFKRNEKAAGRTQKRNPVNYAHLVEFDTQRTKGQLFMTKGWNRAKPQLMATIRASLQTGIRQAAEKAARRGRKR